jgi:hypothetical protein
MCASTAVRIPLVQVTEKHFFRESIYFLGHAFEGRVNAVLLAA